MIFQYARFVSKKKRNLTEVLKMKWGQEAISRELFKSKGDCLAVAPEWQKFGASF